MVDSKVHIMWIENENLINEIITQQKTFLIM